MRLRKTLAKQGYDAGAATIAAHLARDPTITKVPAASTIWRILTRRGFVVPQPQKRPRSSWKRFQADQPNELWQADVTHWQLADSTEVEILDMLDDHSRVGPGQHARTITAGPDVVDTFTAAFARWGTPAAVLTDNGAIFTANPRRRPHRPGNHPRRTRHQIHPLPALPPADLRQGRTLPPNLKKYLRAIPPRNHHRRAATPARRLPRLLQHRPTTPRNRTTAPPSGDTTPDPRPSPPATTSPRTTGCATTASTPPASSPSATTAAYTTSACPNTYAAPKSPCSSTTSTSASCTTHRPTDPQTDPRPHPRLPTPRRQMRNSPKNRLEM